MKKQKVCIYSILLLMLSLSLVAFFSANKSNKKDKIIPNDLIAYYYDDKEHDSVPDKKNYKIDKVECEYATGSWSDEKWKLTIKNITGKAQCKLSFKKRTASFKVEIDPNDGTWNGSTGIQELDIKPNSTVELKEPTREGYTFKGWEVDGDDASIDGNTLTVGNSGVVVKPIWEKNIYKVTITGTDKCDKTVNAEYESQVALCEVEKEGYTFGGWKTNSGKIEGNTFTTGSSETVISPIWIPNNYDYIVYYYKQDIGKETYTLSKTDTFNANYGTEVTPEVKKFEGFTAPDSQKITISTGSNSVSYYYKRNKYTLTVNPDGGQYNGSTTAELYFEETTTLSNPTKNGYNFSGWLVSNGSITDRVFKMGASNSTIKANWTAKKYTIELNLNGGSSSTSTIEVTHGLTYGDLPTPTKEGYVFVGWYADSGFTQSIASDTEVTGDVSDLYAKFVPGTYKLTINANGGTYGTSGSVEENIKYGEVFTLENPTRYGYDFAGWEVVSGKQTVVASNIVTMGVENSEVRAKWTPHVHTLTIQDSNTCDATVEIAFGATYQLCTPVKDEYKFVGWGDNTGVSGNTFTLNVDNDVVLTANWRFADYGYIVYHYKNNINGVGYTLVDGDTYKSEAELGTTVDAPRKNYPGFTQPPLQTITIVKETDNSNPVHNTATYNYDRNKYTLTINPGNGTYNGQTTNTTVEKYYQETYTLLTPERDGYNFTGWNKTDNITDNIYTMPVNGETIVATWSAKEYTVVFNPNGGEISEDEDDESNVSYDSEYGHLPTPTRTGYRFDGWYTSDGGRVTEESIVKLDQNETLVAHWTANEYNIEFHANGGTIESTGDKVVTFDQEFGELPVPEREGYVFLGWYSDEELTKEIKANTTMTEETNDLYAKWTEGTYVLTINANGGTYINTETKDVNVKYLSTYTLEKPTKEGFRFDKWEVVSGKNTSVSGNVVTMGVENSEVRATWKDNIYYLTIKNSYTCDGTYELRPGETYNLCEPSRSGFVFTGWSDTTNISTSIFTMGTDDVEISATWEEHNFGYIVYHYQQNTDGINYTLVGTDTYRSTALYGSTIEAPRKNYAGFKQPTLQTMTIEEEVNDNDPVNNVIRYYYDRNKYTLTINPMGGKYLDSEANTEIEKYYGETFRLETPQRDGYDFDGWIDQTNITDSNYRMPDYSETISPIWVAKKYTITFNTNGGNGTNVNEKEVTYNSKYGKLPIPTRTGYIFVGWFTEDGIQVTEDTDVEILQHSTLVAHWQPKTYTVEFITNGGSISQNSKEVVFDTQFGALPVPVKQGFTFVGWFSNSSLTNGIYEDTIYNQEITKLYAKYAAQTFTLTVDPSGGSYSRSTSVKLESNQAYDLASPSYPGYVHSWTVVSGNATVSGNRLVMGTTNCTVRANWSPRPIKVSFNPMTGSVSQSSTYVIYGSTYGSLPVPYKEGYFFSGWFADDHNHEKIEETSGVTIGDDHTLYAHWTINKYDYTVNHYKELPNGTYPIEPNDVDYIEKGANYGTQVTPPVKSYAGYSKPKPQTITITTGVNKVDYQYQLPRYILYVDPNKGVYKESTEVTTDFLLPYLEEYNNEYIISATRRGYYMSSPDAWTVTSGAATVSGTRLRMSPSTSSIQANWTPMTFTITFNVNGGNALPDNQYQRIVTYDETYGQNGPLPIPTRNYYLFDGWFTSSSGGTQKTSSTLVDIIQNETLYAQWTPNFYNVEYDANGGQNAPAMDEYVTWNTPVTLSSSKPTRYGYTFKGWSTTQDATIPEYSPGSNQDLYQLTTRGKTVTLYAVWEINYYGLTFNANGGNGAPSSVDIIEWGEDYTIPSTTPTREGYDFLGWNVDGNETVPTYLVGQSYSLYESTTKGESVTLYAIWGLNYYRLAYDANTGENAPSTHNVRWGTNANISSSIPTKYGYTFKGWNKDSSATTAEYQAGSSYNLTEYASRGQTLTIYAVWEINYYSLEYNANGGENAPESVNIIAWQENYKLSSSTPTREGYDFLGWSTNSSATTAEYQAGSSYNLSSHTTKGGTVTLYAVWGLNYYNVAYNANGGTGAPATQENIRWGTNATISSTFPTKEHYLFMGWNRNQSDTTALYMPNNLYSLYNYTSRGQTLTLYAIWEINYYNIAYNANGGTGAPATQEYIEWNTSTNLSSTEPTKDDYDFSGWSTNSSATSAEYQAGSSQNLSSQTTKGGTVTLYAVWKEHEENEGE